MSRRIASIFLLGAWLCASGAVLDVVQAIAWTRMFEGYAKTESFAAATRDTFDPTKPCGLCLVVKAARTASGPRCPAAPTTEISKIVLAVVDNGYFVGQAPQKGWPAPSAESALARSDDVPLPPPRAAS